MVQFPSQIHICLHENRPIHLEIDRWLT